MMGLKKSFVVIAIFLVLSILSVVVAQEPTATPVLRETATHTPSMTATTTSTVTPSATVRSTDTPLPSSTPIDTSTASPEPSATSEIIIYPTNTQSVESPIIQPMNQSASAQSGGTCGNYEVAVGDIVSLIAAINNGNQSPDPYTICLQEGAYTLTAINNSNNGLPKITGDITILGMGATGADILRDTTQGIPYFRIFYVEVGASLTLDNVDLIGGDVSDLTYGKGGAILNYGTFTAQNSSDFSNNKAGDEGGAIGNYGSPMTISGSIFDSNQVLEASGNGGAIANGAGMSLIITNSTFQNNLSNQDGGAIYNEGSVDVNTATFTNNSAVDGGAISVFGGSLSVLNSHFSNNVTTEDGGAIELDSGTSATISVSTFSNNSAGIDGGAIQSRNATLVVDGNSSFNGNSATDDGGAISLDNSSADISNSIFSNNSTTNYGGAIHAKDALSIDTVTFDNNKAGVEGGAIYNSGTNINTIDNSTFTNNQILAGGDDGGAIDNHGHLIITNSGFDQNISHGDDGGAIWNDSDAILEIYDSSFTNNEVTGGTSSTGGAIHNYGRLIVANTLFESNISSDNGGAIYAGNSNSVIDLISTEFRLNIAADRGGALYLYETDLSINSNTIISNNTATNHAGGIFLGGNSGDIAVISDSFIENNISSTGSGGAIYNAGVNLTVSNTEIRNNSAYGDGGGIYNGGELHINQGSVVANNESGDDGGGIYSKSTDILKIDDSVLKYNIAADDGGAIRSSSDVLISYISTSCIYGNSALDTTGVHSTVSGFDAMTNWWGNETGPSGAGMGTGDEVNSNVLYDPFSLKIITCPIGQFDIVSADAVYVEDEPPVNLFTSFEIIDTNITQVSSVTIRINNLIDGADELLGVNVDGTNITKTYLDGVLTLAGTETTLSAYSEVIETLTYENTSQSPDEATRDLEIIVTDTTQTPVYSTHPGRVRVAVVSVPDAPVLTLDEDDSGTFAPNVFTNYTEAQAPVLIVDDTTLVNGTPMPIPDPSISDEDSGNLVSVQVDLTNPLDNFYEVISVDDAVLSNYSISSVWAGNSLYLSGSASLADYLNVLDTLSYVNLSDTPTLAGRLINVTAYDGEVESNIAYASVTITNTNTAPTVNLDADNSERHSPNYETFFTISGDPVNLTHDDAIISDPEQTTLSGATIWIDTESPQPAIDIGNEFLATAPIAGISSVYDENTGVLTLTGTVSINDYITALRSLTYQNTNPETTLIERTIYIQVDDGETENNLSAQVETTITFIGQIPPEVTCLDLRNQDDWVDTSGADGHVVWDAAIGMYGVDDTSSGATVSASYNIGTSGNYRILVATSGEGEYALLYGYNMPAVGETAPFTAISRSTEIYDIRDRIIQLEWTVDAANPVFEHLCYTELPSELPDLTVTDVDVSGMVIDPITLEINGTLSATIDNIGTTDALEPFTVLFYEDPDADGYQVGDPILASTTVNSLAMTDPQVVSAPVSGNASFVDVPVYAFVDSDDVVIESNESNNTGWNLGECQLGTPYDWSNGLSLEWEWTGSATYSNHKQVMMTPVVADLNEDGYPDIIFNTFSGSKYNNSAVMRAISGSHEGHAEIAGHAGHEELFTITNYVNGNGDTVSYYIQPGTQIAVGDILGDYHLEIVTTTRYGDIVAFDHNGHWLWTTETSERLDMTGEDKLFAPVIANLDEIGYPEIVVGNAIYAGDTGNRIWEGSFGNGNGNSIVANIDLQGLPEIVAGNTVYQYDTNTQTWTKWWQNTQVVDGYTAVANLDADPYPEIIVVDDSYVYRLEHDGEMAWEKMLSTTVLVPNGGSPLIADLDTSNAGLEIGVAGSQDYYIISANNGDILRYFDEIVDNSSRRTGSSAFDFDGDGRSEIVYSDHTKLWIFDGTNGEVLTSIVSPSGTLEEMPIVVDVDADGHAEIVVPSNNYIYSGSTGIQVYGNDAEWLPTRRIWNQHSYHITNVNDDGSIPTFEANNWDIYNNYRQNVYTAGCATGQPDLTASFPRSVYDDVNDTTDLTVRIGNGGSVYVPAGVSVAFYDGDPNFASSTLLGTTTITQLLEPGAWEDVTITVSGSLTAPAIWMVADDLGDTTGINGEHDELNEDNNIVHYWNPAYYLADLTVNDVDVSTMSIDPNSLEISGTVTATIENIGVKSASETFTVLFYEDPDADGYQIGDPILGTSEPINGLILNTPTQVSASVSGNASFFDVPVYAFVDDGDAVPESNESNNTGWNLGECQLGETQDWSAGLSLKWEWSPPPTVENPYPHNQVMMAPVVADINRDGIPDIVFNSFRHNDFSWNGVIRVISGDGAGQLFEIPSNDDYNLDPSAQIAVGDVDNDGELEIVTLTIDHKVIIFQYDSDPNNTLHFIVDSKSIDSTVATFGGAPMIANLDGVGTSEIIVGKTVFDSNAVRQWVGNYGWGANFSVVANIDNEGLPEVIAGNTVYDANGKKIWQANVPDGFVGIGNIDLSSPETEIIVSGGGAVYLLSYDGQIIGDPISISSGGAPTIADIDNDGQLEIGVASYSYYYVFGFDGTNLVEEWKTPDGTVYDGSAYTGSTFFDFDGDGISEIVYKDDDTLFIFNSVGDGLLTSTHNTSATIHELPVVADVDADGHAEIIVASNNYGRPNGTTGIQVYGSPTNSWMPTRRIWNQHSYHITNVNDDGSIPTFEANNWDIYNNYRQNTYTTGCATGQPDLTASYARRTQLPATNEVQLTARIGNGGSVYVPAGVSVTFYDGDPQNGGNIVGATTTSELLEPGQWEDVTITVTDITVATPLWVVADDTGVSATVNIIDGEHDELNELNNILASNVYVMYPPNDEPTASASADATWDMGTQGGTMNLTGSVDDNVWPINTLTATWEVVDAPYDVTIAQEEHIFSTQAPPYPDVNTTVRFDAGGTYTFRLRVTDGEFTRYSDTVTVEVTGPPVPPTPPQPSNPLDEAGCIVSPSHADSVMGLVDIDVQTGTNLTNASVFYWPAHDPQMWKTLSYDGTLYEGMTITDVTEIIFDTTVLANDTYGVQIVGSDATTGDRVVCGVGLIVTGEYKLGRVVLSTVDFTVPVAGLPITVGRTYDSLERDYQGDFGYGWELAIGKPRLEIDDSDNVTLTMPDGTRKTFYWSPRPAPLFGPLGYSGYFNSQDNGTFTSSGCPILIMSSPAICFPGPYYRQSISSFTYEDPYGRKFVYSKNGDLLSITDLNDNKITFEADRIYSSSGVQVTFERDTEGRIISATAPDGAIYTYVYDGNGDLIEVQLPDTANPISYEYYPDEVFTDPSLAHFFKSGTDANGTPVATTKYYPDGRIETVTDALNNVTTYTYDVAGHTTTVEIHDELGVLLSHEETSYDDYGNVLSEKIYVKADGSETRLTRYAYNADNEPLYICDNSIAEAVPCDANNFTTKYSYDIDGNRTSVTNAEGTVVISASYNDYGGPTSLTDANETVRNITYNAQGMPSTATDVLGSIGSYTWTTQGSPDIVTDAEGNQTNYDYDQYGNVIKVTDAEGNVTRYTYDNMGRRENTCNALVPLETDCGDNTSTTYTEYDALGRVKEVREYDENRVLLSQTEYKYDANGNRTEVKQISSATAEERITTYTYDDNNRVTEVKYPDGTSSTTTYDHRGNVKTQTDVRGVSTCYDYDLAGQLIETVFACNTANEIIARYEYDGIGRRIHSIEGYSLTEPELALHTLYTYDTVGRIERMQVTNYNETDIYTDTCYDYDEAGQLLQMRVVADGTRVDCNDTNVQEAITKYDYDARGRREMVTYPDGSSTASVYDGVGRVTTSLDAAGTPTQYTYDALGNLKTVTQTREYDNPLIPSTDIITEYQYDVLGRRIQVTQALGLAEEATTRYVYDGLSMHVCDPSVPTSTNCDGVSYTSSSTYNLFGEIVAQTDAKGYETAYEYIYDDMDNNGTVDAYKVRVTSAHDINIYETAAETVYMGGQRISTTVGINADLLTPNGFTTTYDYDEFTGRLIAVCDASVGATCDYDTNATTKYGYDTRGRQNSVTDANGHETRYSYDPAGRLESVTAAYGTINAATTSYSYDTLGRRVSMTDAENNSTRYSYDIMGRVLGECDASTDSLLPCDAALYTSSYLYDDDTGRQIAMIDGNGNRNDYTYNNLGWLLSVKNGEGNTVRYDYDNMGRITEIKDANYDPIWHPNATTSFAYDERGLLTQKTWADGNYESYAYDANGNLASQSFYDKNDVLDVYHYFDYDSLNRLIEANYEDDHYFFKYNSRGQRTEVQDNLGNILSEYDYDVLGRPTQIDTNGQTVAYTYDPVGNRETIETQIDGIQQSHVTYGYDELNRLDTVTDSAGVTDLTYNKVGMLTIVDRPNNVKTTYNYDALYQVTGMLHEDTSINTDLAEYTYGYDAAGNRESMTHTYLDAQGASNTVHYDYGYDKANRLTSETRTFNLVPSPATEYRYDANGNRVQEIRPNDDIYYYTYNKNDQLTRIDNPDYTYQKYEYDARGNLDTVSNWQKGVIDTQIGSPINYTYDARNQLIDFDGQASFAYDHDGRRISATAGVTTTNYLWDEFSSYGDVILETSGANVLSYTLANGAVLSQTNNDTTHYLLPDAQNSTRALTDVSGGITDTFDYSAFGELIDRTGTNEAHYLYTGQQYDATADLYSLRARYYDPEYGRFLTRDTYPYDFGNPIELNRYVYTANNPINFYDPTGYMFINYTSVNTYVGGTAQFVLRDFGQSVLEGAVAGVLGYILGTFLYHFFTNITYQEWIQGNTIDMGEVLSETLTSVWNTGYNLVFSAIFGSFLGGANYLTGTGLKSHWIEKFGTELSKDHIDKLIKNMVVLYVMQALAVSGAQAIFSAWASDIQNPYGEAANKINVSIDVIIPSLLNGTSYMGSITNLSPAISIMVTTGFNAIATLASRGL